MKLQPVQLPPAIPKSAGRPRHNELDALAPTNFTWVEPVVLHELVDQDGANLVKGTGNFRRDMSRPPRLPASVDRSKFEVGDARSGRPTHRGLRAHPL